MTFSLFLRHIKTHDAAVIHVEGSSAAEVIGKLSPSLGSGWEVTGAMSKEPGGNKKKPRGA